MAIIGEKIKLLRAENGYTQEDFSHKIGISRSNLAQIETGKANPTFETIGVICNTLKVDANYLVDASVGVIENVSNNVILNTHKDVTLNDESSQNEARNGGEGTGHNVFDYNKKSRAFYKKLSKQEPELDVFVDEFIQLELLLDDLKDYVERLNKPFKIVNENILASSSKTINSETFIKENIERLIPLKKHVGAVKELIKLINSVLLFEEFEDLEGASVEVNGEMVKVVRPGA